MAKHKILFHINLTILIGLLTSTLYSGIETQIIPNDVDQSDRFGYTVAMDDNFAFIGAPGQSPHGAAYVYQYSNNEWVFNTKLTANDEVAGFFGCSAAIDGNYAIIGAEDSDEKGTDSGSAYIFKHTDGAWTQEAKLTADDGTEDDRFGINVAISGDYAAVGAYYDDGSGVCYGAVYIYKRSGTNWVQQAKVMTCDDAPGNMTDFSISISGDYVALGAYWDGDTEPYSGSVYVFKRSGTNWNQDEIIVADDAATFNEFGVTVSLYGDNLIVGANGSGDDYLNSGSAYIFSHSGSYWRQKTKLTPLDGNAEDSFGFAVSMYEDRAVVGAHRHDAEGDNSGCAYVFKQQGNDWTQETKLMASDASADYQYGQEVAIYGDHCIIGSFWNDTQGHRAGSAYLYCFVLPPEILNVQDIPHDQGGQVNLQWQASYLDIGRALSHYSIWRSLPNGSLAKSVRSNKRESIYRYTMMNGEEMVWEWLADQPTHRFQSYAYIAATCYDSISTTSGTHYFLVSAQTDDPDIFYDSEPMSGYSVDDLSPAVPMNVTASTEGGEGGFIELNWNASTEPDFAYYILYRNNEEYAQMTENFYSDQNVLEDQTYTYKLKSVDIHENESAYSQEVEVVLTQVISEPSHLPDAFYLCQNYPNPFNPSTTIVFDLPKSISVSLKIYNLLGKEVETLLSEYRHAGKYEIEWSGENHPSGIYLYRLEAGDYIETRKLILQE